ncbi:unnamed protein product [Urochloa decumbens]|uniref:TF-B3 domain-containing protein n=1 Tax=Urochloa decumbens TaxID=240449 RepID=A0ABC9B3Y3_9POAL
MQQSGTKMPFAAIHRADDVAALPLQSSPERNERCGSGAPAYERPAPAAWLAGAFPALEGTTVRDMVPVATPARRLRQGVREHLFQKALTPSDVGNLNRLVVPKQHAEKHFLVKRSPFMAAGMGVLLGFEDGEGKTWRFRYSYCRSSRIYILTKGWRRFVREKELQAGDTVAFYGSAVGPFKKLHIDYWKWKPPQKKQDDDNDATPDVTAIDSHVVKLFGVDIARGCPCRQGAKVAIST